MLISSQGVQERDILIDSDTSRDCEELNVLASRYGATEYDLFSLAFYDAHGYQADDILLQDLFMDFLQCGAAPSWLRSYVRNRFQSPVKSMDNIKQSTMVSTCARSAVVKWRPQAEIFSFTLVGHFSGDGLSEGAE